MRQISNESPNQFYKKIMSILNCISNFIEVHTQTPKIKRSKHEFFHQQVLTTFLAGLREPMRSTNLTAAEQYIQEENNIKYTQKSYKQNTTLLNGKPNHNIQTPRQHFH